jgi:hypothetical protein
VHKLTGLRLQRRSRVNAGSDDEGDRFSLPSEALHIENRMLLVIMNIIFSIFGQEQEFVRITLITSYYKQIKILYKLVCRIPSLTSNTRPSITHPVSVTCSGPSPKATTKTPKKTSKKPKLPKSSTKKARGTKRLAFYI